MDEKQVDNTQYVVNVSPMPLQFPLHQNAPSSFPHFPPVRRPLLLARRETLLALVSFYGILCMQFGFKWVKSRTFVVKTRARFRCIFFAQFT